MPLQPGLEEDELELLEDELLLELELELDELLELLLDDELLLEDSVSMPHSWFLPPLLAHWSIVPPVPVAPPATSIT